MFVHASFGDAGRKHVLTQSIAGLIRTAMTTHARDASGVGKAMSLLSSLASSTDQRDVAVLMSFTEPIAAAMAGHDADAGVQVRWLRARAVPCVSL